MIINNISIRKAKRTDLSDVFLWRNDRCSRDNFFNQEPIEFTSHAKWYQRALVDPDMFLFIGLLESKKIGVCRFDVKEENMSAEISINLNPIFRGKNLSKIFLEKSIEKFLNINNLTLLAKIKNTNNRSEKIFEKCGFLLIKEQNNIRYYKKHGVGFGI